jgi:Lrp/AsnC family leucine-responsive transcriptional regulator
MGDRSTSRGIAFESKAAPENELRSEGTAKNDVLLGSKRRRKFGICATLSAMYAQPIPNAHHESHVPLDPTDYEILRELADDARVSWAELGRRVALTAPAVRERVRRLERMGVITGYHVAVDPVRLGRTIDAFVRVATPSRARQERLVAFASERDEIVECHSLTGEDCYLVRVQVPDMSDLEHVTASLALFGRTTTSLVLGTPVDRPGL